jgi:hypothetical protein
LERVFGFQKEITKGQKYVYRPYIPSSSINASSQLILYLQSCNSRINCIEITGKLIGRKGNARGKITNAYEILVKTHNEQQNTIESKGEEHMSLRNVTGGYGLSMNYL